MCTKIYQNLQITGIGVPQLRHFFRQTNFIASVGVPLWRNKIRKIVFEPFPCYGYSYSSAQGALSLATLCFWLRHLLFYRTQVRLLHCLVSRFAVSINVAQPNQAKVCIRVVKVVTCNVQSCYMHFLPSANLYQAEV